MTERELRELEKLKTVDDYKNEIANLADSLSGIVPDERLDNIITMLTVAMTKKYKYIIKMSAEYRRRQGWFSKMRDYIEERRQSREKEDEEEPQNEEEKKGQRGAGEDVPSLPASSTEVEVIAASNEVLKLEQPKEKPNEKQG